VVHRSLIDARLSKLGIKKTLICWAEIRELARILMDDEQIINLVSGRYHGGFAVLVATDQRLLLVDKKPLYLTLEDTRYDMISEVDISARLFDATVTIFTVNRQHRFTTIRQYRLRELVAYVQRRVMEFRHYQHLAAETAPAPLADSLAYGAANFSYPVSPSAPPPQVPLWQSSTAPASSDLAPVAQAAPVPQSHWPHLRLPQPQLTEHLPKAVGAAAINGSRWLHNPNPYTRGSLLVRSRQLTLD